MSSFPLVDVNIVKGNAPKDVKDFTGYLLRRFMTEISRGFADSVGTRLKITEISVQPQENAPKREEATVVCELEVQEDMVNGEGNMHGGCSAYLIDLCTTLPLATVLRANPGVSKAINMVYHAPAPLGTPLRIISTSVAVGGRAMTARGEIWDTQNCRLVASGTHVKMLPSRPKL